MHYIITALGCKVNQYETQAMEQELQRRGHTLVDFESPKCMDMDLLNSHFAKLSKGETIVVPKFEFARQMRNDHLGTPLRLKKNEIAIFEGIHALNDACAGRNPAATTMLLKK